MANNSWPLVANRGNHFWKSLGFLLYLVFWISTQTEMWKRLFVFSEAVTQSNYFLTNSCIHPPRQWAQVLVSVQARWCKPGNLAEMTNTKKLHLADVCHEIVPVHNSLWNDRSRFLPLSLCTDWADWDWTNKFENSTESMDTRSVLIYFYYYCSIQINFKC